MAARAFVLISVEPARTQSALEHLRAVDGASVYEILGPFDFIVDLESADHDELARVLQAGIRSVPGVTATLTCEVIQSGG